MREAEGERRNQNPEADLSSSLSFYLRWRALRISIPLASSSEIVEHRLATICASLSLSHRRLDEWPTRWGSHPCRCTSSGVKRWLFGASPDPSCGRRSGAGLQPRLQSRPPFPKLAPLGRGAQGSLSSFHYVGACSVVVSLY